MERCRDEPCGEGEAEVEVACERGRWRQLGWQMSNRSERVVGFLNSLHAAGRYIGRTGWTHGKAKVTFSWWYSSKIVTASTSLTI